MTGCHGMECLDIEAKIICAEKKRSGSIYLISTKVDGSKLQIEAKSISIVTIQNYISMKTFFFQLTEFK